MDLAAGVLFGLLGLLGWGFADFLAKKLVDKIGGFNALLFQQLRHGAPAASAGSTWSSPRA